jgi:hypothetical protein
MQTSSLTKIVGWSTIPVVADALDGSANQGVRGSNR